MPVLSSARQEPRWWLLQGRWRELFWSARRTCPARRTLWAGQQQDWSMTATPGCSVRALRRSCVVVTTSLAVLEELAGGAGVQVRLTGGAYRRSSHDLSGNAVIESLGDINADKVFFGAAALSFRKGVMNYDADMPRAFLHAGKQRILAMDSSKLGLEAVYRLCPVESCDLVITDSGVKSADLARLRKLTKVLVAK